MGQDKPQHLRILDIQRLGQQNDRFQHPVRQWRNNWITTSHLNGPPCGMLGQPPADEGMLNGKGHLVYAAVSQMRQKKTKGRQTRANQPNDVKRDFAGVFHL